MKEKLPEKIQLASTSLIPKSYIVLELMMEQYNRGGSITTLDYPSQKQNSFVSLQYFFDLQTAEVELKEIKNRFIK